MKLRIGTKVVFLGGEPMVEELLVPGKEYEVVDHDESITGQELSVIIASVANGDRDDSAFAIVYDEGYFDVTGHLFRVLK